MSDITALVADNLDVWTRAVERKSGAGRGGGKRISLYGIDRLRALILDLAVRGKLVSQDAGDEPAEKFFKRLGVPIRKNQKPNLNRGWAEASLADLGEFVGGITPSKGVSRYWGEGHPWVSPKDMGEDQLITSEDQVTQAALEETSLKMVPAGSLVMVARSGILRRKFPVAITNMPCTLNQDMKALVLRPSVNQRYLQVMLKGFQPRVLSDLVKTGMTVESLIFKDFTKALWPIPPLAEQQRIVAKVDELMALCNALEHESAGAMAAHQALVEILLATLVKSADATDLARDWARLERHFDTLFTTDASIDSLKQTILALAVRGKLVDQDGADAPAAALLQNVEKQRAALLKKNFPNAAEAKTQLKKQNIQKLPIGLPRLPHGWDWATLMQCSMLVIDCKNKTAPYADEGVRLIRTTNVRHGQLNAKDQRFVSEETFEKWSLRAKPIAGDLLITREAPMGEACLIPEGELICLGQRMMLARFIPGTINARYILITFMAPDLMERVQDKPIGMTVEHLRVGGVETLLVPIPPLAEQRRIVAKVDALLALCDALKARLADAAQTQRHLADAITQRAAA